ncbi:unnamed protein product [Nezara viridula]|uniref:Uncharacterized protein n=1 Tax=Nezara viridula TaxID=85310 RepID=A0A9P0HPS6_NEZVI|nr:unnamed protein product [Nezara viridula]
MTTRTAITTCRTGQGDAMEMLYDRSQSTAHQHQLRQGPEQPAVQARARGGAALAGRVPCPFRFLPAQYEQLLKDNPCNRRDCDSSGKHKMTCQQCGDVSYHVCISLPRDESKPHRCSRCWKNRAPPPPET